MSVYNIFLFPVLSCFNLRFKQSFTLDFRAERGGPGVLPVCGQQCPREAPANGRAGQDKDSYSRGGLRRRRPRQELSVSCRMPRHISGLNDNSLRICLYCFIPSVCVINTSVSVVK